MVSNKEKNWSYEQNEEDELEKARLVPEWSTSFSKREVLYSFTRVK